MKIVEIPLRAPLVQAYWYTLTLPLEPLPTMDGSTGSLAASSTLGDS